MFALTIPQSCGWTAVSSDPSWLTITQGGSGTGNGTIKYSVAAHSSTSRRTGMITVAGRTPFELGIGRPGDWAEGGGIDFWNQTLHQLELLRLAEFRIFFKELQSGAGGVETVHQEKSQRLVVTPAQE